MSQQRDRLSRQPQQERYQSTDHESQQEQQQRPDPQPVAPVAAHAQVGAGVGPLEEDLLHQPTSVETPFWTDFIDPASARKARRWMQTCIRLPATCPIVWVTIGLSVVAFIVGFGLASQPVEIETNFDSFLKTDVASSIRHDAFEKALEDKDGSTTRRLQADVYTTKDLFVAYELKEGLSGGLLNTDAMATIADFERALISLSGFRAFCSRTDDSYQRFCNPGLSLTHYILPTRQVLPGQVVPDILVLDANGYEPLPTAASFQLVKNRNLLSVLFPSSFNISDNSVSFLRSAWRFRIPVGSEADPIEERNEKSAQVASDWEDLARDTLIPFLEEGVNNGQQAGILDVWFDGTDFTGFQVHQALENDIAFATGSMVFIFLYLLFHTRSIVLSLFGIVVCLSSVPLAYITVAVLFDIRTVSFTSFLALFLILGFGSDVIFVYKDYWQDSAAYSSNVEERLEWMYRRAAKASFATTGTTALSFFANLASVIRALRQFGFFMGLCVMIAWLLITTIFAPLCVADELYFKNYNIDRCVKTEKYSRMVIFRRWSVIIWRRRYLFVLVAWACAIGCIISATLVFEMSVEGPSIFPAQHNQNYGQTVFSNFETGGIEVDELLSSPPPIAEDLCDFSIGDYRKQDTCPLFWCERQPSTASAQENVCECYRNFTYDCSSLSATVDVPMRFVGYAVSPGTLSTSDTSAIRSWTQRQAGVLYDGPAQLTVTSRAPTVLEEWETGHVAIRPVNFISVPATRSSTVACRWEDVCFCGEQQCLFPNNGGSGWSYAGILTLSDSSNRRLQSGGIVPTVRPTVSMSSRTKVRVVFGIRVVDQVPLLGEDPSNQWSFLESFDLKQPWAQRDLFSFIANMPTTLKVTRTWSWIVNFRTWSLSEYGRFPMPVHMFNDAAMSFISSGLSSTPHDRYVWVDNGEIRAVYASQETNQDKDADPAEVLELKGRWDDYCKEWDEQATLYARGVFHVSDEWVLPEAQSHLLFGTAITLLILIVLSFFGMLLFTRSTILSTFVVWSTIVVVGTLAFFIVVLMTWKIGLIEVVAMIYFIGYAVTYSLHITHVYASRHALRNPPGLLELEGNQYIRYHRTRYALESIGGAALGSAITTAGASIFLVFCTLTVFKKLGSMCLAVTIMSIFVALGPLPAVLMIFGPQRPGQCFSQTCCCRRRRSKTQPGGGTTYDDTLADDATSTEAQQQHLVGPDHVPEYMRD